MLFSTGNNVIDIDIAATNGAYSTGQYTRQRCQCPVCRNFDEQISAMDRSSLAFLEELGVVAAKCPDLWAYEPGERAGSQKHYLLYPVKCKVVKYDPNGEEWLSIRQGLSVAIKVEGKAVSLLLDWELAWTHK